MPCTVTVQPGQSIQAAIDAAPEAAVICLEAGIWEEDITISKSLTLKGAGADQTIIERRRGRRFVSPVIKITSEEEIEVVIEGLTAAKAGKGRWSSIEHDGIQVQGRPRVTIQDTIITRNEHCGISIGGTAQATIQDSTIERNGSNGILIEGSAQVTIINNIIKNNKSYGIISSSTELVQGSGNRMRGNYLDLATNVSANLRAPLVPETGENELSFPGPYSTLQETIDAVAPGGTINLASGTYQGGITVWKPLTLKGEAPDEVVIKGPVSLIDEARGVTIERVKITGSQVHGLIIGSRAQATVTGSTIQNSSEYGIAIGGSAQATIADSTVEGNGWGGIAIQDSAQATITNNVIKGNKRYGIVSGSTEPVQGSGNRMKGNYLDLAGNLSAVLRVPVAVETEEKELSFPGPYATLQETIDALAPGGTINLAPGTYQGGITIWKPLSLKGEAPDEVVLAPGTYQGGITRGGITIWKPLSLKREAPDEVVIEGPVSLIDEARGVTIEGVKITGSQRHGLIISGRAQATVTGSTIQGNSGHGISIGGSAQATIEGNKITNNFGYSVVIHQRPCFDTVSAFKGAVQGKDNEIHLFFFFFDWKGVCPSPELDFLMTKEGGCYGPLCPK